MRIFVKTSVYSRTCIELFILISDTFKKYFLTFVCVEMKQSPDKGTSRNSITVASSFLSANKSSYYERRLKERQWDNSRAEVGNPKTCKRKIKETLRLFTCKRFTEEPHYIITSLEFICDLRIDWTIDKFCNTLSPNYLMWLQFSYSY